MIKTKRWHFILVLFFVSVFFLASCGSENVNSNNNEASGESNLNNENGVNNESEVPQDSDEPWAYHGDPVTLEMMIWIDQETFNMRYKNQVEEKFPDITLELVSGGTREHLEELFASGEMPDIYVGSPTIGGPTSELVEDLDFLAPIEDEYIIPRGFDLNIYQDGVVDNLRAMDPMGEEKLYGLPLENSVRTMFYNKDIFDLFGEEYPKNDMTWDEVLDLAERLTVERDGIQYKGLAIDPGTMPYMQLSIPGTDPETGELLFVDHPDMKRVMDLYDHYRSIPNMMSDQSNDGFHDGDRNIAMTILNAPWFELLTREARENGFNFDMVNVPTWESHPGIAPTWGALAINITKHSENKDAAWSVISYLASEEGQLNLSRAGSPPVIDDVEAINEFTSDSIQDLDIDYNVTAPFTQTLAKLPDYSKYDYALIDFLNTKLTEFWSSDQDPVTYLREIGEEYEGIIEDLRGRE